MTPLQFALGLFLILAVVGTGIVVAYDALERKYGWDK